MSQQIAKRKPLENTEAAELSFRAKTRLKITPMKIIMYVIVIGFAALYLFPMIYLLNVALMNNQEFTNTPTAITQSFKFDNFTEAWSKGNFARYLFNTILYTGGSTFLHVTFSMLAAFPIARGYIKGGKFLYMFFLASLFLPSALIPQFQLMLGLHLYNTQIGYILLNSGAGLGPFLIAGYLTTVPKDLDEAAAIDGCGYFRFIFSIIVPLIKPILVTVIILHSIGVWNDIIGPIIYLPNPDYSPVTRGLFNFKGQFSADWPLLAAATMIVAAPLLLLYIVFQRYFIEGAVAGSIKG